ncbi:MAG: hypothetical protein WBA22_00465 [Candidatus Methanofastidiosia archaeon]
MKRACVGLVIAALLANRPFSIRNVAAILAIDSPQEEESNTPFKRNLVFDRAAEVFTVPIQYDGYDGYVEYFQGSILKGSSRRL